MDQDHLFKSYIDVCNQALIANEDKFPYNRILSVIGKDHHLKPVRVNIINDMGQVEFNLQLMNNKIIYNERVCNKSACGGCCGTCFDNSDVWKVCASYLNEVVTAPEKYIQNPALLDWEWVRMDD